MKVAVTSRGSNLGAELDPRFGRARFFVVVDTETDRSTVHDNKGNLNILGYAGIKAAEAILKLGVHAVITGKVGPKALARLKAGDVEVYVGATGHVGQAVEQFKRGELECIREPTVEGHWMQALDLQRFSSSDKHERR
ncbi:MAG: NifB/NifX family molybdenum-iron cluster-binding protein [Phycisphaerae bacterium]|nr:NifB/NifX family molybdenum-iron cluster-binding protein [Phycisphaerae bacterium]